MKDLNRKEIDGKDLEQVNGGCLGMANPVAGLTKDQAIDNALKLGDGMDMGSWGTMSAEQYIRWWAETNNQEMPDLSPYIK